MRTTFLLLILLWLGALLYQNANTISPTKLYDKLLKSGVDQDTTVYLSRIDLLKEDTLVFQNKLLIIDRQLELGRDTSLSCTNCVLFFEQHYNSLLPLIQREGSSVNLRNCIIASYEDSDVEWILYDDSRLLLNKVENRAARFYLDDFSYAYFEKTLSQATILLSAHPRLIIKDSPAFSLHYELANGSYSSFLHTGLKVNKRELTISGSCTLINAAITQLHFTLYENVELEVRNASQLGIFLNYSETEAKLENFHPNARSLKIASGSKRVQLSNVQLTDTGVIASADTKLTIRDASLNSLLAEGNSIVEAYGTRINYGVAKDYSALIIHNSIIEKSTLVGDFSSVFLENTQSSYQSYNNRFRRFYIYEDGKKSN